ncbi:MAG TPA: hypothetical protein VFJ58_14930 [Armatimonadota bacterium]|nr:hypothetical protein [Armatimonadota bacterium]
MNTKTHIKCACGQRVVSKDVLTTGYLLHTGPQLFVFVKFRCSRCKKLGQEVVNRARWDWSVLEEEPGEVSVDERKRFQSLGPIPVEEAIEFHFLLEESARLETLVPDEVRSTEDQA